MSVSQIRALAERVEALEATLEEVVTDAAAWREGFVRTFGAAGIAVPEGCGRRRAEDRPGLRVIQGGAR